MVACKTINVNKELREKEMTENGSCPKEDSNLKDTKHTKTNNFTRGKTSTAKVPPTKRDGRKFFVGGLPGNVTDNEFREFFEAYGTVVDSIVMIDRETRRSRGFGFVTFAEKAVAEKLLGGANKRSHMIMIRGKFCEVKNAEPKKALNGQVKSKSKTNNNNCKDRSNQSENSTKSNQNAGLMEEHTSSGIGKDEGISTTANYGNLDMTVDIYGDYRKNSGLYPPPYSLAISPHMSNTPTHPLVPFQNNFPHVQPTNQRLQDDMAHSTFHVYSPYHPMVPDPTLPVVYPSDHCNKAPYAYQQLQQTPMPYYYPLPGPGVMPVPWMSHPVMPNTNHHYTETQISDDFHSKNVAASSEAVAVNNCPI